VVAGSEGSEDVEVVWCCLVVSLDRLPGFLCLQSIPPLVVSLPLVFSASEPSYTAPDAVSTGRTIIISKR
jgi:hypothetical protein